MDTAVLAPPSQKNGRISIRFDDWEVQHFAPRMPDEEFLALCKANPDLTIEQDKNGNIFIMPPVSFDSGGQELEAGADLAFWNRRTKLGKVFSSQTLFVLPDGSKRMPDAAWIAWKKINLLSPEERKSFAPVVPDFVIEVCSPSDEVKKLKEKIRDSWIANGVRLVWLFDAATETAWIFRADGSEETVRGFHQKLSGEDVLPGFEFDPTVLLD